MSSKFKIAIGCLFFYSVLVRADLWKLDPESSVKITGHNFLSSDISLTFTSKHLDPGDGKSVPTQAVTAVMDLEEKNGSFLLKKLEGNIWTKTIDFPEVIRKTVADPGGETLFGYSDPDNKYNRMHFSAKNSDISSIGKNRFLIHAKLDVKDLRDIPVDLEANLVPGQGGKMTATVTSLHSKDDRKVASNEVDRERLNIPGFPLVVDKGVVIKMSVTLSPATAKVAAEEPKDFVWTTKPYTSQSADDNKGTAHTVSRFFSFGGTHR